MTTHPILFVAPTRIGDAVLASSILAHLAATDPNARVTIATSPLAAPLYEGFPQLERIILIPKRSYNRHWLTLWRETSATRWHAVWDMRSSIVGYVLRASRRYTYVKQAPAPKVKQYEAAFGTGPLPYPVLWPRADDAHEAAKRMPEGQRYLVFAPIANYPPKEWPLAAFTALAQRLLTHECKGYRPVIICAGHERERARPMLEALAAFHPVDLTAGDVHLLTIYACMQRAQGFIGNDSGLMHMAAATSIPTLGIFGPTPSDIYQPWGTQAAFVQADNGDLGTLAVDAVLAAFVRNTPHLRT